MSPALTSVAILIPLFVVPISLGSIFFSSISVAVRWWFGATFLGFILFIAHSFDLIFYINVVYLSYAIITIYFTKLLITKNISLKVDKFKLIITLALSFLLLAAYIKIFCAPLLGWDATVIWFNKARAIFFNEPFKNTPFVNYPNLGPIYWMYIMKFTGTLEESFGRLFFPTLFFFWILSLTSLYPHYKSKLVTLAAIVIMLIGYYTFNPDSHLNGYQDEFLAMCLGLSALHFLKVFSMEAPNKTDYFLSFWFSGISCFIKNEGFILALILITSWAFTSLIYSKSQKNFFSIIKNQLPNLLLFLFLLLLWRPMISLYQNLSFSEIQGDAFTVKSILSFYTNFDRLPLIIHYFASYFAENLKSILLILISIPILIYKTPRFRPSMVFLFLVLLFHLLSITLIFLSTTADLSWHLETAFMRLASQHSFIYTLLIASIPFLQTLTLKKPTHT